jgi:hypothetical protein
MKQWLGGLAAGIALLAGAEAAQAGPITLTVGSGTFTAGGDNVTTLANTVTYNLTPNVPFTGALQGGNFDTVNTGGTTQTFAFTLTEVITVGSVTGNLSITGQLIAKPGKDSLSFFASPVTTLDLGSAGKLDVNVTPQTVTSATAKGITPFTLNATFNLRPAVPEPTSLGLLGLGAVCLLWYARRRSVPT